MRKNTPRHWLHAVLVLLPVLLIPVFMIYSHRHAMTELKDVDIQYKYQSNEVNSVDDLIEGNIYYLEEFRFTEAEYGEIYFVCLSIGDIESNGIYNFDDFGITLDNSSYIVFNNVDIYFTIGNSNIFTTIYIDTVENPIIFYDFIFQYHKSQGIDLYLNDNHYIPQYTDYNIIESVEVNDTKSSVMNVFMDDFNTAIDKYFNMGNVFGMHDVYNWFINNIFNGSVPLIVPIVWNIILYEFVLDLLFLLYGLFMWFIDMLKALIEKPIKSIK